MTVSLSQLRVSAGMDASNYVAGVEAIDAANRRLAASGQSAGAALAATDAAAGRSGGTMVSLSKAYVDGYATAARFSTQLKQIQTQMETGMGAARATQLYAGLTSRFGLYADAVKIAAAGNRDFAAVVDAVNAKAALQIDIMGRAAAAQQRLTTAQATQSAINSRLGVTEPGAGTESRQADIVAYGTQLDELRAKYNPLFAAQQAYKAELADIARATKVGAIRESERAEAVTNAKVAFVQQVNTLRGVRDATNDASSATTKGAAALGLARHEAINLSRQLQDVVVSYQGGQGIGTILIQQGSQIADVFVASQGTVGGFFRQTTAWLGGFLTAGRIAFAGVTAAIGVGASALMSYSGQQKEIERGLNGIGRASGVTRGDVNAAGLSGASMFGQSVSEAREFAATLAATGRVGAEVMTQLTGLGHDFAKVLGIDGKEAAATLAKAMADPVSGAEQLNQKLGFLDAAQARMIRNLTDQNRLGEAQKIIVEAIKRSIADANVTTGFWATSWTAIANGISNSYDWLGRFLSRGTGIGETIEEQYAAQKKRVDDMRARQAAFGENVPNSRLSKVLPEEIAKLDQLQAKLDAVRKAGEDASQRLASQRIAGAALSFLPEVSQLDDLKNKQELLNRAMAEVTATGGQQSEALKRWGLSYEQFAGAVKRSGEQLKNFKTDYEQAIQSQAVQLNAVTAFSPSAKGDIAYQQRYNSEIARGTEETKAASLAENDRTISLRQSQVAMSEAARERELAARQGVEAAQLDISLIGKTIGEQTRLRADLQARHQLEQEAARNRTAIDEAEYARLQKINAELGAKAQARVKADIGAEIQFDQQTAGLTSDDVQIAQQLRGLYPDVAEALNSVEAAQIRVNMRMKDIAAAERTAFGGLINDLVGAKTPLDALTASIGGLANQMAKVGASNLFDALKSGDFSKLFNNNEVSLGGIAGIGGAGLNAYQSGSPLGGALGGVMAGLATGNPMLALAGAAVGRAGSLFN